MLVRIWKTRIAKDRLQDLRDFAQTESLPMFKKQAGCLGVFFTLEGDVCATISLWEDMQSIEDLKGSPSYNETVEKIIATGMLRGDQTVEVFDGFGGFLEVERISKILQPKF